MGLTELLSLWKGETRRLLWIMAALVIIVTLFQYVELPKGPFVLSIFSMGKFQLPETNSTDSGSLSVGFKANNSQSEEAAAPEPSSELDETDDVLDGSRLDVVEEQLNNSTDSTSVPEPSSVLDDTKEQLSVYNNHSLYNASKDNFALAPGVEVGNLSTSTVSPISQPPTTFVSSSGPNLTAPVMPVEPHSPPEMPVRYKMPFRDVYTLADMYELLGESRWATHSMVPSKVDQELLHRKSEIENAAPSPTDAELYGPIYRNVTMFRRSYELMEQTLKVYVYKEGDKPVFHSPPLEGIYASEGWFMKLMESNKHFVTKDPTKAHLFYMPFSSRNLEETLYVPNSHNHKNLIAYLEKYLENIIGKYSFWNRTEGADHFLVACHDWAPSETRKIMSTCIRAMCNADMKEGFKLGIDVSLPETYIPKAKTPLRGRGGKPASQRRILAFFAGQMHGYLRPILLQHWENVDPDMKIFGKLPHAKDNKNYVGYMQRSKYCICPRGYEVNSPRVVEAIFYECVPVIISDNFVPPFLETLNWESFAVFVAEKEIPKLKSILESIPKKTYLRMYMRVKKVQQHFLWHPNPVKYDLFHMILHSIWYNRVFQF